MQRLTRTVSSRVATVVLHSPGRTCTALLTCDLVPPWSCVTVDNGSAHSFGYTPLSWSELKVKVVSYGSSHDIWLISTYSSRTMR